MNKSKTFKARYSKAMSPAQEVSESAKLLYREAQKAAEAHTATSRAKLAKYLQEKRKQLHDKSKIEIENLEKKLRTELELEYQKKIAAEILELEQESLHIAIQVAEEVIEYEISTNRKNIIKKIENTFQILGNKQNISLEVSNSDIEDLKDKFSDEITIKNNHSLQAGEATIHTNEGSIHLNWHEKLRKKKEQLKTDLNALQESNRL